MTASKSIVPLIYHVEHNEHVANIINNLEEIIKTKRLPLQLDVQSSVSKLSQKQLKALTADYKQPIFIVDNKQTFSLVVDGLSVSPQWQRLQQRVVSAGRKSELILQACKPSADTHILDATAGFGHDSLILASSGAQITMLEQNPLIALLLLHEQQRMLTVKNWQKLIQRLHIEYANATNYLKDLSDSRQMQNYDVVYLDPMFPESSYEHRQTSKGAKVGKHMQALHHIALPPTKAQEDELLTQAKVALSANGRVVVKRPVSAPYFADKVADETWQNDVVRFDAYFV